VAARILALRENDNWDLVVPYVPSGELAHWQPTPPAFQQSPLLPNWPLVTPWAMAGGSQFRVAPPPAYDGAEFAAAYNEVKSLGAIDSATRTEDQTIIAFFWEDGGGSVTPPGHWHVIAQSVAQDFGNDLSENARLFALLSITQADAAISSWDNKYFYDYVRPVSGIQLEGDLYGNPDTQADPTWLPLIPTPPFPAYTSGHSSFSGSSARILEQFFGTSQYAFCGESPDPHRWPDVLPGVVRCWSSFEEASSEGGQSRIYGRIHWQFDNQAGFEAGRALASYVYANFLSPL
jgi:hypothetical protein